MPRTLAYQIDGVQLFPQPDDHEWEPKERMVIGLDGNGKPIPKKYRSVTLRVNRLIDQHQWDQFDDGSTHSVILPAPNSPALWTTYTNVYVRSVTHGKVTDGAAMDRLEMKIIKVVA